MTQKQKQNLNPFLFELMKDHGDLLFEESLGKIIQEIKITQGKIDNLKNNFDKNLRQKHVYYKNNLSKYPKIAAYLYVGMINNKQMAVFYSPLLEGGVMSLKDEKVVVLIIDEIQKMYQKTPTYFVDKRKDKSYPKYISFDALEETWLSSASLASTNFDFKLEFFLSIFSFYPLKRSDRKLVSSKKGKRLNLLILSRHYAAFLFEKRA